MNLALPAGFSELVGSPLFGASGLLFLALALLFFVSTRRKLHRSTRVPGKVVGHEEMSFRTAARGTPTTRYLPIVEYTDRHGASRHPPAH